MLKSAPQAFSLDNFYMGLDWTTSPLKVESGWLVDAKNVSLNSFRSLEKRKGCVLLYATAYNSGAAIKSIFEYKSPSGTDYVLVSSGTNLGYYYDSAWVDVRDDLTDGLRCSFATLDGYCYIVNGTDPNFKLYSDTAGVMSANDVLGISAPTVKPTVSAGAASTLTGNYRFVYAFKKSTFPAIISNYSPKSDAISVDSGSVTLTGYFSDDHDVDTIVVYRSLDMGDAEGADTENFFKLKELSNNFVGAAEIGDTFVGTGVDDLGNVTNTVDPSTNFRILLFQSGSALSDTFVGAGLDDLTGLTNTTDTEVWLQIRVSNAVQNPNKFRVSTNGTTWTAAQSMSLIDNSYGYTHWHFGAVTGHTQGNYWIIKKTPDKYKISTDDGANWGAATACALTNTYGNTSWTWGAITGHTTNDYWDIASTTATLWTITSDATDDNSLLSLATNDNTPPPKSKFIASHKNRMFYAHCPEETDGKSLFMFSSSGKPECVPSTNYQYFDKNDGYDITGIVSLPDYLVVFKQNKIAVMEGDFEQWYTISNGIGCIAPWSITAVGDKAYFISEEGWKATDGRQLFDIGKKLGGLNRAQYLNAVSAVEYTSVYYPEKYQIMTNLYHATYNNFVLVGHALDALYQESGTELSTSGYLIGWTYHEYDNHVFRTLGTYTDANGITKILAGSNTGFVYQLDSTEYDVSSDISIAIETGWTNLGVPETLVKTVRGITAMYASGVTSGSGTVKLYYDVDLERSSNYVTLSKGGSAYTGYAFSNSNYYGPDGMVTENLDVLDTTVGRIFRFRLTDTSHNSFLLASLSPYFRVSGRRT